MEIAFETTDTSVKCLFDEQDILAIRKYRDTKDFGDMRSSLRSLLTQIDKHPKSIEMTDKLLERVRSIIEDSKKYTCEVEFN